MHRTVESIHTPPGRNSHGSAFDADLLILTPLGSSLTS